MGGKEEEMEVRRRKEEGLIIISDILSIVFVLYKTYIHEQ